MANIRVVKKTSVSRGPGLADLIPILNQLITGMSDDPIRPQFGNERITYPVHITEITIRRVNLVLEMDIQGVTEYSDPVGQHLNGSPIEIIAYCPHDRIGESLMIFSK